MRHNRSEKLEGNQDVALRIVPKGQISEAGLQVIPIQEFELRQYRFIIMRTWSSSDCEAVDKSVAAPLSTIHSEVLPTPKSIILSNVFEDDKLVSCEITTFSGFKSDLK